MVVMPDLRNYHCYCDLGCSCRSFRCRSAVRTLKGCLAKFWKEVDELEVAIQCLLRDGVILKKR
jgi:hypothetical protein